MAILNVNMSRMELNNLKNQLITTRKGHKLLKNKSDGLLREFLNIYKKTVNLREKLKEKMQKAAYTFELAKIEQSKESPYCIISYPNQTIKIKVSDSNFMGTRLPCFCLAEKPNLKKTLNYSFLTNSKYMDDATIIYTEVIVELIELCELEKSLYILSTEIDKTRRKVNAIENILIPNLEETIKFISLKLEENERSTKSALRRIKF